VVLGVWEGGGGPNRAKPGNCTSLGYFAIPARLVNHQSLMVARDQKCIHCNWLDIPNLHHNSYLPFSHCTGVVAILIPYDILHGWKVT
jgi:hypothetical protein